MITPTTAAAAFRDHPNARSVEPGRLPAAPGGGGYPFLEDSNGEHDEDRGTPGYGGA